jgi:pseudouridylate synthase
MIHSAIKIRPDVAKAIAQHRPVVALESTIISHGMPYPENVATALECERIIESEGAIPATIAILDGVITVGLTKSEIDLLGRIGHQAIKVSRRDIPFLVSQKQTGSLTVAATMIACEMAGIRIFATGGIGGVHRFAETTFDISADLQELAKTNVCVISAGMKAILDLPKTMEYLETMGVPVVGYQTSVLPAFYTRESNIALEHRLDTPEAIAKMLHAKWSLDLQGGVVVANPIPEADSFPAEEIETAIRQATSELFAKGISGKQTTPFLLQRIAELTEHQSLDSNISLVWNNCRLGAKIAVAYVKEERR